MNQQIIYWEENKGPFADFTEEVGENVQSSAFNSAL